MVMFDTRLMLESRQMDIDFVNQLEVYCRLPRQWESCVGMLEANQLEYCSRLRERTQTTGFRRRGRDVGCVATED